jgi:predicted TIM-barrel fold metal-dependent hydrolase
LVLGVGGLVALAAVGWLLIRRQFRALLGVAVLVVVGVALIAVYSLQKSYPNADLFGWSRIRNGSAVMLGTDSLLSQFQPMATLKVPRRLVERAAFPAIDVHFHLESMPESVSAERLVAGMDAAGISKVINLGGNPGMFERFKRDFYDRYPDRFIMFVKPDPADLVKEHGFEAQVRWVEKAAGLGARGVKIGKTLGIGQRDRSGRIVAVDDPRFDPLWDKAGELGMPVLIHTSEPTSFFQPTTPHNERYEELLENPDWSLFRREGIPTQAELLLQREHLLARHPKTHFIGAHMGSTADDLSCVAHLLDTYPNYYVDMSSVVSELGRQPFTTREFFIHYQDRILFGSDGGFALAPDHGWTPERFYRSYIEFLETRNEYIEYPLQDVTKQGMWRVYGIDLPADVLEKIYVRNAEKLIPSHESIMARLSNATAAR